MNTYILIRTALSLTYTCITTENKACFIKFLSAQINLTIINLDISHIRDSK